MKYTVLVSEGVPPSEGSISLLERDGEASVLPCSGSMEALEEHCRSGSACILLSTESDLEKMARRKGATALRELTNKVKVVVMARDLEGPSLMDYLFQGCWGAVPLGVPLAVLSRALEAVRGGELWFPRRVLADAIVELLKRSSLTRREIEILQLVAQGCKNEEIASRLFITRETVRSHLRALYAKLGLHDRRQAAAAAVALQLQRSAKGN